MKSICKLCKNARICGTKIIGSEETVMIGCSRYEKRKPITNYDLLIRKTPEELADWVWGVETAGRAYGPRGKKAWLDWLKQEAKDD